MVFAWLWAVLWVVVGFDLVVLLPDYLAGP